MGNARRNTMRGFNVDAKKLTKLLKKTGKNYSEIARSMGFGESAVSTAVRNGRMSYGMADCLSRLYSIEKEEYEYAEKVEEEKVEPEVVKPIDPKEVFNEVKDDLYKLMYSAVYEAVKKAWAE